MGFVVAREPAERRAPERERSVRAKLVDAREEFLRARRTRPPRATRHGGRGTARARSRSRGRSRAPRARSRSRVPVALEEERARQSAFTRRPVPDLGEQSLRLVLLCGSVQRSASARYGTTAADAVPAASVAASSRCALPPPAWARPKALARFWRDCVSTWVRSERSVCTSLAIASSSRVSGSPGGSGGNWGISELTVSAATSPGYQLRSTDHDQTRAAASRRRQVSSSGADASHSSRQPIRRAWLARDERGVGRVEEVDVGVHVIRLSGGHAWPRARRRAGPPAPLRAGTRAASPGRGVSAHCRSGSSSRVPPSRVGELRRQARSVRRGPGRPSARLRVRRIVEPQRRARAAGGDGAGERDVVGVAEALPFVEIRKCSSEHGVSSLAPTFFWLPWCGSLTASTATGWPPRALASAQSAPPSTVGNASAREQAARAPVLEQEGDAAAVRDGRVVGGLRGCEGLQVAERLGRARRLASSGLAALEARQRRVPDRRSASSRFGVGDSSVIFGPSGRRELAEGAITLGRPRGRRRSGSRQRPRRAAPGQSSTRSSPSATLRVRASPGCRELRERVEPTSPTVDVVPRQQREHAADVVGVDVRHDDDVDHALAGREGVDPRLDALRQPRAGRRRPASARGGRVAGALDPDRVSVGGVQDLDRDCGSHST